VETVCLGFAASTAQFLLYAVDIAIQAEQIGIMRRLTAELTAQHTGQSVDRILADGDRGRDRSCTPEAALDHEMIDDIVEPPNRRDAC